MTSYENYLAYVADCAKYGMKVISFTAWQHLFPLDETSF